LGSPVQVAVKVDGVGQGTTRYTAPALAKADLPRAKVEGFWGSSVAAVAAAVLAALLIGWVVFASARLLRPDVRSRIAEFVPDHAQPGPERSERRRQSQLLADAERQLEKSHWWGRFREDVDVAKIK